MGIQDQMKADMGIYYDAVNGFAVNVSYTPFVPGSGASPRTIPTLMDEQTDAEFETGTADLDFDIVRFRFRSDNDVTGVMTISEQGRGSVGDSFVLNGTTWYVKKKLTRPNDANTFEHILICSTSKAPLPDHFG